LKFYIKNSFKQKPGAQATGFSGLGISKIGSLALAAAD
jgi:hypothetical protein